MKYVITGGAGNISKPLSEKLLAAGHEVTVVGRNAEHLKLLTDKGANAAIGSVEDVAFLKTAFAGADAVYTMIPPQYAAADLEAFRHLAANYAEAIRDAQVNYVVNLSSVGAHMAQGAGPVSGLYRAEEELNKLTGVNILHLRPCYFFTNLLANLDMVKGMNIIGGNMADADTKLGLSHPADIAEAAAEALLACSFSGHGVQYLGSDEQTAGEIASVLGAAVNKPELPWVTFTDEQAYEGMKQAGLPEPMAQKYAEMGNAIRTGKMYEDYWRQHPQQLGKTKLKDFAKEFAAAYNAS